MKQKIPILTANMACSDKISDQCTGDGNGRPIRSIQELQRYREVLPIRIIDNCIPSGRFCNLSIATKVEL